MSPLCVFEFPFRQTHLKIASTKGIHLFDSFFAFSSNVDFNLKRILRFIKRDRVHFVRSILYRSEKDMGNCSRSKS
ncbi:hypothetical protein DLM75_12180 [Leptospira stimsonii]|uniref:Uncharacterized protein n=1 Tax=Leptospira stimsonii TaxID=2202203 RepID=A0A396Z4Q8_9LEPT|nr:hypothetical protein DLM75_12180 [Leptospira stimsonii]